MSEGKPSGADQSTSNGGGGGEDGGGDRGGEKEGGEEREMGSEPGVGGVGMEFGMWLFVCLRLHL